jgi:hypothetical protein
MALTKEEITEGKKIVADIETYIEECGGNYSDWYVGITGDITQRLFGDHNVDEDNDNCCWEEATSSKIARAVEKHFIEKHGTQGGPGGGDDDSVYVYAYEVTNDTVE